MSSILGFVICSVMILVSSMVDVLLMYACVDLSRSCVDLSNLICYQSFIFVIYHWIKIKLKVLIFPTIQKPYFRHLSFMASPYVEALRPPPFDGKHFKRWQVKATLWLNAMNVFWVSNGKPEGTLTPDQEKEFAAATTLFVGAVISVIADHLQDVYINFKDAKELWDELATNYGGSDAGTELYIIEQYNDYKMIDGKSVVAQAHEIQCLVKELALLKIVIPDRFVAGGIIAKLPPSWRDFATTLKHKRT